MMKAVVHRFSDQLEYSTTLSDDEAAWVGFYRRLWPDMVTCVRYDADCRMQRDGIDREIVLVNGRRFFVDEKKRKKDYGDVLLEEWSVFYRDGDHRNKIGWALDPNKRCDFVAYAVPSAGKCYLLPFELLRQAFLCNRAAWVRQHGSLPAWNDGYATMNTPLPWNVLKAALIEQMLRKFNGNGLQLPTPVVNGHQLEFAWSPEAR